MLYRFNLYAITKIYNAGIYTLSPVYILYIKNAKCIVLLLDHEHTAAKLYSFASLYISGF